MLESFYLRSHFGLQIHLGITLAFLQGISCILARYPMGTTHAATQLNVTNACRYIFLLDIVAADDFRYKFHNR